MIDHTAMLGTPNGSIPLCQTTAVLAVAGRPTTFAASVILRLANDQGLIVELTRANLPILLDVGRHLTLPHLGLSIRGFVTSSVFENGCLRASFTPSMQPISVNLGTRKRLACLRFGLINFPAFFGLQAERIAVGEHSSIQLSSVSLNSPKWRITITALPDLDKTQKILKRDGGHALTHSARAELASGLTFTVKEARELLTNLRHFISFARGSFSSTALVQGFDRRGEHVWDEWGTFAVAPSPRPPSWFDTMNCGVLSEVFPGFLRKMHDPHWCQTIRKVLYWYLRSNRHGQGAGVDGGLILSQAALERLAYGCGFTSGKASTRIRAALKGLNIPSAIPKESRVLRRLARRHAWHDGVHAIIEIRNDLVHPNPKYGDRLSGSYFEAWNLAQLYVELILLRLFDHRGFYGCRIMKKWQGQVKSVPWV